MNLQALRRLWGEWEIRVLLVGSLLLQVFLLFAGGLRKRSVTGWLRMLLWLAYLLADSIAIYALGNLSQTQKHNGALDHEMHIFAFWAPFLILHLGGQDTITAFAMEDNELWLRHLLNLVSQVVLAVYVYWKSRPSAALLTPAVIMFVSGVVKYGERTWALRSASMGNLRSSLLTPPDAGPNYPKFVEMYQSSIDSGLNAQIVIVLEQPPEDGADVEEKRIPYDDLVYRSYKLFETFRRIFVDLILSFQDRTDSLSFFRQLKMEQAFKVVEIELGLMYDSLHSKCSVIHGPVGRSLRVFTLAAPLVSLRLFAMWHDADGRQAGAGGYKKIDIVISYVLLAGAVFLETYAILLMIVSPWTYAHLRDRRNCRFAANLLFWVLKFFQPEERPRWSSKMAQYNLISYCLKDKSRWHTRALEKLEWGGYNIHAKTMWDALWYTSHTEVLPSLKLLLFKQLKEKANSTTDPVRYKEFGEHRGQWVLQRNGCYQQLGWSVEVEFDESILLWHIATDLCFYGDQYCAYGISWVSTTASVSCAGCCCFPSIKEYVCDPYTNLNRPWDFVRMSREISNYMLFLLVMRPFMMTASIGQIRFGDTCAEAKSFFRRGVEILDEKQGADMLSAVKTSNVRPRDVKGDRSKSVLFDACRLAEALRSIESRERRWRLISGVWAEMLCYAAGKCRGNFHARQLSQGGELLTMVWLLMVHFGMGEQYRVESGHARAKLIIET
ncbi:hypothetical protein ACP70R_014595 [Stipagrostis hirtigluma subsp. patula]